MNKQNIWFCGVPGSKWSGIDTRLREVINADRSDETDERRFYHRPLNPNDPFNGHSGSYFGPGMGCGENWIDFNYMTPADLQYDIDEIFTGEGIRVIKSHQFARHFNLDYIWNHFAGDYIALCYRESQKSFAWWCEVMDFTPEHYPDYRPAYTDYNHMRPLIFEENAKICDFAMRKGLQWELYNPSTSFSKIKGFNQNKAKYMEANANDIYIAYAKIPEM